MTYYEQALSIYRKIGDLRDESVMLGHLGQVYSALGVSRTAIGYHELALNITLKIGDRRRQVFHLGNLGRAHNTLGDSRKAIEYYDRALASGREAGDRIEEGTIMGSLRVADLEPSPLHSPRSPSRSPWRGTNRQAESDEPRIWPSRNLARERAGSNSGSASFSSSGTPSFTPSFSTFSPSFPASGSSTVASVPVAAGGTWRPVAHTDLPMIAGRRVRLREDHDAEGEVTEIDDRLYRLRIRGDEWNAVEALDVYDTRSASPPPRGLLVEAHAAVEAGGLDGPLGHILQIFRGFIGLAGDDGPLFRIVYAFRTLLAPPAAPLAPADPRPAEEPDEFPPLDNDDPNARAVVESSTPTPSHVSPENDPVATPRFWRAVTHADLPTIIGRRVRRRDEPAVEGVAIERDNKGQFLLHVGGHEWHRVADLDLYDTEGAVAQMPPLPDTGVRAPAEAGGLDGPLA